MASQDPNNLVNQARKTLRADPSGGGDLSAALGRIAARTFVVAFTGDVMFRPEECRRDASRIPGATYREIQSSCGHLATFGLTEQDRLSIDGVLREILGS